MLYDTNIVVLIAFLLFVALLGYVGVHRILFKMLDERAAKIRTELDEARRLREEAQTLLASYERRQREIEDQAAAILMRAQKDAEDAAEHAKAELKVSLARRIKAAEEQIGLAEKGAIKEVRDRAIDVAIAAASEVLTRKLADGKGAALLDGAIETVGRRLN